MTEHQPHDDPVLQRVTAVRPPLVSHDLSATGERATAILTRLLAPTAPTPPIPTRRRRRPALRKPSRMMLALSVPVTGLAALVVVIVGALSGSGSIGPQPAAGAVLRGVATALAHQPGTILVERYNVTYTGHNGKTSSWQQTQIYETPAGSGPQNSYYYSNQPGQHLEQAVITGNEQLYLPATNTVYVGSIYGDQIRPGKKPGTYTYAASNLGPGAATLPAPPLILTARQARGLRDGSSEVNETLVGHHIPYHVKLTIVRAIHFPSETSSILSNIRAHRLRVAGLTVVDGHPAIKLVSIAFHATHLEDKIAASGLEFYVDPHTYRPIKLIVNRLPLFRSVQTFTEYQTQPITAVSERLLNLAARHPGARVDHNPADFRRALGFRPAPRAGSS